jgi:exodeoxyribonuclease V beta subunit
MREFDVTDKALLTGANLIEASAGTGKTFSIAVLVVRLIIEKSIPVTKMLLVTFTDTAATELKERSLKFIRDAINEFDSKGSSGNKVLAHCVEKFKQERVNEIDDAIERLYSALLEIDQAKMCTIHSFCQQTLNEFAFETNQSFGKVLLKDISQLSNKYCNAYRREVLNAMEYELFEISGLKEEKVLTELIKNAINDKTLYGPKIEISSYDEYLKIDREMSDYLNVMKPLMINKVEQYDKKNYKRKLALEKIDDTQSLRENLLGKPTYDFNIIFATEIEHLKDLECQFSGFKNYLQQQAIDWILSKIKTELLEKNEFTFDDLINQLYAVRLSAALQKQLRAKYDVVFLDEFQDTDQKQYDIFREVFQNDAEKIIFYIGDPKQSIYGFRKADLNTYFNARNSIHETRRFEMKVNYRSSQNYISALNTFYKPIANFDTFHTSTQELSSQIEYTQVSANNKAEGIKFDLKELPALTIIEKGNTKSTFQNTIKLLLDSKTTLNNEKIKPSNICVLTRSNKECKEIKRYLNELNVPSVISDDSRVIKATEAKDLSYILGAFLNSKKSAIQKALLTNIVGLKANELHTVDMDRCVELFSNYYKIWIKNGIYVAVNKFLEDFNVINKHNQIALTGQRILSNVRQLLEILQEKETHDSLTPNECYLFLKSGHKSEDESEINAFVQRIESDEDAAKIVTIHKSKGLEYDIVIAPFLDMNVKFHHYIKYYNLNMINGDRRAYVFTDYTTLSKNESLKELFDLQNRQENARLLYVALTRAKYGSFILSENIENILAPFIEELRKVCPSQISITSSEKYEYWNDCSVSIPLDTIPNHINRSIPKLTFPDANYNKMSYSFLASHPAKTVKVVTAEYGQSSYDEFIFNQLQKGANIGNMLHDIFEFIDYTDASTWEQTILNSVRNYQPNYLENTTYIDNLNKLIHHVMQAPITFSEKEVFQLKSIERKYRRNEFEFNFTIPSDFKMMDLEFIFDKNDLIEIATKRMGEVQGMMNGFIDLFFKHNDKYYILDWKSNFLGDAIEHYHPNILNDAMNESNYHLQYCIYTVAIKRYLESKIGNDFDYDKHFGGVIYLFLRGVRKVGSTGIYTNKLPLEKVEKLEGILNLTSLSKV